MLEKIYSKFKKKKNYQDYIRKYKIYIYLFIASLVIICIFSLLKPVLFKSWLKYPLQLRAEIAFDYFVESFNEECFGVCLKERQNLGMIIIKAWQEDISYWQEKIFKYFNTIDNYQLKKSIVSLSLAVYESNNIPNELRSIVYDNNYSYQIRHYIISAYNLSFIDDNNLYLDLISKVFDTSLTTDKRQSALLATRGFVNNNNLQIPFHILTSNEGRDLKKTALELINSWSKSELILSKEDISLINQLINDNSLSSDLEVKLIWLLSEYYYIYPDLINDYLQIIYNNESLKNISRGFSAKALNYINGDNLEIPDISQDEWERYYITY